jgi:hypothetical protein
VNAARTGGAFQKALDGAATVVQAIGAVHVAVSDKDAGAAEELVQALHLQVMEAPPLLLTATALGLGFLLLLPHFTPHSHLFYPVLHSLPLLLHLFLRCVFIF